MRKYWTGQAPAFVTPKVASVARFVSSCAMRKVLKTDLRPMEIKPQEKSVWICLCGLSKNQPFCDGSHKTIAGEEDGKTYEYDAAGHRVEV